MSLLKQLRGAYSDESRMNLMHYCDLAANEIERLQSENTLLKREVLAADATVMIGGREMVVHSIVKVEIEYLRNQIRNVLAAATA